MEYTDEQVQGIVKAHGQFQKCEELWDGRDSSTGLIVRCSRAQRLLESVGFLEEAVGDPALFRIFTDADSSAGYLSKKGLKIAGYLLERDGK